jgi:hypothetical protein
MLRLTLRRTDFQIEGIFGELILDARPTPFATLEHAYRVGETENFKPKVEPGTYKCVRGPHRLHNMTTDFSTFEITGVAGHKNILFHSGNFNKDSEGCVLIGLKRSGCAITDSRVAFQQFMEAMEGVNEFILTVI